MYVGVSAHFISLPVKLHANHHTLRSYYSKNLLKRLIVHLPRYHGFSESNCACVHTILTLVSLEAVPSQYNGQKVTSSLLLKQFWTGVICCKRRCHGHVIWTFHSSTFSEESNKQTNNQALIVAKNKNLTFHLWDQSPYKGMMKELFML